MHLFGILWVKGALCKKCAKLLRQNPWRNWLSKLVTFDPIFQLGHGARVHWGDGVWGYRLEGCRGMYYCGLVAVRNKQQLAVWPLHGWGGRIPNWNWSRWGCQRCHNLSNCYVCWMVTIVTLVSCLWWVKWWKECQFGGCELEQSRGSYRVHVMTSSTPAVFFTNAHIEQKSSLGQTKQYKKNAIYSIWYSWVRGFTE